KPLADRVVLKMEEPEQMTQSGIILSASSKEKPQVAKVIAAGPGNVHEGKLEEMYVKVGDKVLINKYGGQEVTLDDEEYTIVRQSDILGIIE
ncbi:MAG: co-chaperone GroES, partial [Oscillospiraceae bacterium]